MPWLQAPGRDATPARRAIKPLGSGKQPLAQKAGPCEGSQKHTATHGHPTVRPPIKRSCHRKAFCAPCPRTETPPLAPRQKPELSRDLVGCPARRAPKHASLAEEPYAQSLGRSAFPSASVPKQASSAPRPLKQRCDRAVISNQYSERLLDSAQLQQAQFSDRIAVLGRHAPKSNRQDVPRPLPHLYPCAGSQVHSTISFCNHPFSHCNPCLQRDRSAPGLLTGSLDPVLVHLQQTAGHSLLAAPTPRQHACRA
mmetsp:Transcript_99996/g.214233  ORF Transcript_99996/g.214233 Transcript_99996/m.214233 type:complete len:254 (+) Transcript_99996:341-1102(+)